MNGSSDKCHNQSDSREGSGDLGSQSAAASGSVSQTATKEAESKITKAEPSDLSISQNPQNLNWNFDDSMQKNPFSDFSEEHLTKLDEVLQSASVQELLQQSGGGIDLLALEQSEAQFTATPITVSGGAGDGAIPSTSAHGRDNDDILPMSKI
ncbi:uncharacterized protein LOC128204673 [Mya arenaria]|uniref:uncharacterized protein LOC128204673 n=1 Tax=Mya arenaria TaxID=6604 RepID=UPI0022E0852E|nr:uncharacterized protein LOC128204673 [Mya arenaria]